MNNCFFLSKKNGEGVFPKRSGFVLICVLFFIAMLISLVLVMTLSMNSERIASFLYFHRIQAQVASQEGVDRAMTLLTAYTSNSTLNWVSMPGKVLIAEYPKEKNQYVEKQLSSGVNVSGDDGDVWGPFNLNQERFNEERTPYLNPQTTQPLYLNWIYVRRDGTREIGERPVHDPKNPLQARYAFWVDDESCRININQAWSSSTNNTNVLHHPSRVDLRGLEGISEAQAKEIHQNATNRPVLSPKEYLRLTEGGKEALSRNDYSITTRSHSLELNPWGEPKIVLTTQKNLANGRPYLDILNIANTDPGQLTAIDRGINDQTYLNSKYYQQSQKLMDYMRRTDWPYAPGKSFVQKYGEVGCLQIATDIIDYVRNAESTNQFIQRIEGDIQSSNGRASVSRTLTGSNRQLIVGGGRTPPIVTEMVVNYPAGVILQGGSPLNAGYFSQSSAGAFAYAKVYLPKNGGIDSIDLQTPNGLSLYILAYNQPAANAGLSNPSATSPIASRTLVSGSNPLMAGQSATYRFTIGGLKMSTNTGTFAVPSATPARLTNLTLQAYYKLTPTGNNMGHMPRPTSGTDYPLDPLGTPLSNLTAIKVGDPRTAIYSLSWAPSPNQLFSPTTFYSNPQNIFPPQDTASDGSIPVDTIIYPYPKGHPKNPLGVVQSVAELGAISTHYTPTSTITNTPVIFWKTLRLQPTPSFSVNDLPDWALLDLFTVPMPYASTNGTTNGGYQPLTNSVTGRINVNAMADVSGFSHQKTIEALLYGMTNITSRSEVVQNILNLKTALNGVKRGPSSAYISPHELCEIEGVADRGEESEATMKTISALGAVRGNVFRIYSIGQSLQETPQGDLIVKSQNGIMSMVERTSTNGVTAYIPRYWKRIKY